MGPEPGLAPFPAHLGWIPVLGPLGRARSRLRLLPGAPRVVVSACCGWAPLARPPWASGSLFH